MCSLLYRRALSKNKWILVNEWVYWLSLPIQECVGKIIWNTHLYLPMIDFRLWEHRTGWWRMKVSIQRLYLHSLICHMQASNNLYTFSVLSMLIKLPGSLFLYSFSHHCWLPRYCVNRSLLLCNQHPSPARFIQWCHNSVFVTSQ